MKTVTLIIDGKEVEAQVKEEDLKLVKNKREFGWQEEGEPYFCFQSDLTPIQMRKDFMSYDEERYDSGNYFLTEKECADAARVVSLWLQMKRFACEHNESNIDFTKKNEVKYFLGFDYRSKTIVVDWILSLKGAFQIYFDSKQTAKKAIDEFHDELIWYFTEYEKDNKITTSKEIQYEVNVGSGCAAGTIFVDENATDEEIKLAIMDDLYDINYHEVVKEED